MTAADVEISKIRVGLGSEQSTWIATMPSALGAPKGLSEAQAQGSQSQPQFNGASTPEPHEWAIMLCLAALAWLVLERKRA